MKIMASMTRRQQRDWQHQCVNQQRKYVKSSMAGSGMKIKAAWRRQRKRNENIRRKRNKLISERRKWQHRRKRS